MTRADALKSHGCPVRAKMTAKKKILTSNVCSTDESELKEFPLDKMLSQSCSTDEDESKVTNVNECSTEED